MSGLPRSARLGRGRGKRVPAVEAHRFAAEPSAANVAISVAGRCRSGSRAVAVNSMICPSGQSFKTAV